VDGKTAKGWRSAKSAGFPPGLVDGHGELAVLPKGGGGDIMTDEEFGASSCRWSSARRRHAALNPSTVRAGSIRARGPSPSQPKINAAAAAA
jgi:hypothetical protein